MKQSPRTTHRPIRRGRYPSPGKYIRQVMGAILRPLRGSPAPRSTAKGDNGISTCVAPRVARPMVVRLANNTVRSDRASQQGVARLANTRAAARRFCTKTAASLELTAVVQSGSAGGCHQHMLVHPKSQNVARGTQQQRYYRTDDQLSRTDQLRWADQTSSTHTCEERCCE